MTDTTSAGQTGTFPADFRTIQLDLLDADPQQPRKHFDPAALESLGQSIRDEGLLQPLVVRPGENGRMQIVAGERRARAARQAGLTELPVIVRADLVGKDVLVLQLTENLQREDLAPADVGAGVARLVELLGSAQAVAAHLKKSDAWVSTHAALVKLPEPVKQAVEAGVITSPDVAVTLGKLHELDPKAAGERMQQFHNASDEGGRWGSAPTRYSLRAQVKEIEQKVERKAFNAAEKKKERAELSALKEKAKTDPKAKAKLEKLQKENSPSAAKAAEAAKLKRMKDYIDDADAFVKDMEAAFYRSASVPLPKNIGRWQHPVRLVSEFHGSSYNVKEPPASIDLGDFAVNCRGTYPQIQALATVINSTPKLIGEIEGGLTIIEAKKLHDILGNRVTFHFEEKRTGKKLRAVVAPSTASVVATAAAPVNAKADPFGVAAFLKACTVKGATSLHRVSSSDLHNAYATFAIAHPDIDKPLTIDDKRWGGQLKANGLKSIRSNGIKYTGIKLAAKS